MTDDELRELVAGLAVAQAKTDAQMAKTDAKLNKLSDKLNKLSDMYGGVGNNQGKAAENFHFHSLQHRRALHGRPFDHITRNMTRELGGVSEEYDLVAVSGSDVFVVEVKYRLHPSDIAAFVTRKVPNFSRLFPEYRGCRIHPVMATFSADDAVAKQAVSAGVTLLQRRGKVIETLAA